jgi:serine/threonine protein kinase
MSKNITDQKVFVAELILKHLETIKQQQSELGNQLKDFKIEKELGRGSFGTVYLVTPIKKTSLERCVMKKISLNETNNKSQLQALEEVQYLRKLNHPHVIQYYTSFLEKQHLYIVMEYA